MHMNFSEILLILIVAVLVIPPKKLPETMKTVAASIKWIQKKVHHLKKSIFDEEHS